VILRLATEVSSAALGSTPAAEGSREGRAAVWLTGEAEEEGARGSGEARPAGRGRAGRAAALMSSYGAPAWWSSGGGVGGVLLARLRVLLLFALHLLLLLSLSRVRRRRKETGARVARVFGRRPRGSYGAWP
jgi:hypothetical protein